MPIMAIYRSSGVDRGQYDAVLRDLDAAAAPEPGAMLHVAGFAGQDTICVVDVWESREQLEGFRRRLEPVLRKHGVPSEEPEILDVHGLIAADALDAYRPALAPA